VHVAPAYAWSGEGSDHFGSFIRSLALHFCKRLFSGLESVTSWSQGNSFTLHQGSTPKWNSQSRGETGMQRQWTWCGSILSCIAEALTYRVHKGLQGPNDKRKQVKKITLLSVSWGALSLQPLVARETHNRAVHKLGHLKCKTCTPKIWQTHTPSILKLLSSLIF
jgi:hypothetical protein